MIADYDHAYADCHPPMIANDHLTNDDYQQPISASDGYQQPISASDGYQQPINANDGYQQPISANDDHSFTPVSTETSITGNRNEESILGAEPNSTGKDESVYKTSDY